MFFTSFQEDSTELPCFQARSQLQPRYVKAHRPSADLCKLISLPHLPSPPNLFLSLLFSDSTTSLNSLSLLPLSSLLHLLFLSSSPSLLSLPSSRYDRPFGSFAGSPWWWSRSILVFHKTCRRNRLFQTCQKPHFCRPTTGESLFYELASTCRACIYLQLLLCRELLMTVNIPVQKRNTTCRNIASAGSKSAIKNWLFCLSRWQHSNGCYDLHVYAHPLHKIVYKATC